MRIIYQNSRNWIGIYKTGRSTALDSYNSETQVYLSRGFLVDFKDNDLGFERIKRQEAALFYFGSKFYEINDKNEKYTFLQTI